MTEITEQIPYENERLNKVNIHQCILSHYDNLSDIYRAQFDTSPIPPNELPKTYPMPFIFYHHTEDSDHLSKLCQLGDIMHAADNQKIVDGYTEDDAETQYLSSSPVSFLIIGKPDIGQTELAQLISEKWKCVHISPESVLKEEIVTDTRAAKCIKYNLESGRSIGPEVILRLVEKRIKSQSAQHRGYVLSGFPLLKNDLFREDPISSESAVFNVLEIFEDLLPREPVPDKPGSVSLVVQSDMSEVEEEDQQLEEIEPAVEEEDDKKTVKFPPKRSEIHLSKDIDLGPSDTTIVTHTEPFHILKDPKEQLSFLQNLLGHPLLVIYVMCGTIDACNKRDSYRYNFYLQREVFSTARLDEEIPQKSVPFNDSVNMSIPFSTISDYIIDGSTPKMQVQLPMHFKKSASAQIWQYQTYVHNILKKYIMEHNPQHFMKVDGRLTPAQMYDTIYDRLKMLAFQPVLLPETFVEDDFGEGATVIDLQATPLYDQLPENSFKVLRSKMIIGPMYKFQLSNWGYKCPVAHKEGRIIEGRTEYAVKFMNKIFFLSSEAALIKFYRNPRSYILPIMPQPSCRMWIVGPGCSGKSVVAKCLSFLFGCKILDPRYLKMQYMKRKEEDYLDKIRSTAITKGIAMLNKNREQERTEQIATWKQKCVDQLQAAVNFTGEYYELLEQRENGMDIDEEDINVTRENEIQEELRKLSLPSLSEMTLIQELLTDPNSLMDFLPDEYKSTIEPATVFDSFVSEYVESVISNTIIPDMSLSIDEKVEMFKIEIDQAEEEHNLMFQRLGGWIIDGMTLDMDILIKLSPDYLPDEVICLVDEQEDHAFLLNKFARKDFSIFNDYGKVFSKLKLESVVHRNFAVVSASSKLNFIDSLVTEVEDRVMTLIDSETTFETLATEKNKAYEDEINRFKSNWQLITAFLTECKILVLEINVENKSTTDLLTETIISLENRYRKIATIMTDEERVQEQIDFAEPVGDYGEGGPGEGGESGNPNFFEENRRLGLTNIYCPIVFDRYFVLWKGKEQFAVTFEQQVYLLSSEAAMNEFVINPRLYLQHEPPKYLPPARICVIGVPGGGKSSISTQLAENYGLHYVNYDDLILNYLNLQSHDMEQVIRLDPELNSNVLDHLDEIEMLNDYINNDITLKDDIIRKVLSLLWFNDMYKEGGFVLDNFPKRPSDVKIMIENYLIPDIVIEFHINQELACERSMPGRMEVFRGEVNERRRLKELANEKIISKWREDRLDRMQIMAEEKRQQRKIVAFEQNIENRKLLPTPIQSGASLEKIEEESMVEEEILGDDWFVYDEIMELEDLEEINKILDEELPEPIFHDVWETEEETRQKILDMFEIDFQRDIQYLDLIRNNLQEANIDCSVVDTQNFTMEKVLYEFIRLADKLKFRNQSLFERVYEITLDVAERLLEQGYYFVSKFGRTCPVQVFDNANPIQMFLPGERKYDIYPCIHKRFIYFIHSEDSRNKFILDPLKYVTNKKYKFPLIPLRVSIIGPPKCGKTTLAERFEKEFKMKVISRGSAIRFVQNELPNSELAKNINFILNRSWSATSEMVAKAVESLTMHPLSLSQGYIMDGFPNTEQEVNHMRSLGILPHIVLDIQTSMNKIEEYSRINFDRPPFPSYSLDFIKHVFKEWERDAQQYRALMHKEYQNIYQIENLDSKWRFWDQAKHIVFSKMKEYQSYIVSKEYDKVLIVKSLSVSSSEFFRLQSVFFNYCPLCYYFDDYLLEDGAYPDRNCVFQYIGEYYYICPKHQKTFIDNPKKFIPPINEKLLPKDLPTIAKGMLKGKIYEEGLCVVSFWDHQPKYCILKGDENFSVIYKGIYYLFCSEYCMKKFMATPGVYYNKLIHFKNANPVDLAEITKLPTLGYFEQLTARLLVDAVIHVEIERPYFVGLNIPTSAALQIAMYLKRNNPKTPKVIIQLYDEMHERQEERRRKLKSYLAYFKGRLNPFVTYVPRHKPKAKDEPTQEAIEYDIRMWLLETLGKTGICG